MREVNKRACHHCGVPIEVSSAFLLHEAQSIADNTLRPRAFCPPCSLARVAVAQAPAGDVREVSGCIGCPGNRMDEEYREWHCVISPVTPQRGYTDIPTVAPDWYRLRKGPVTLLLKEGA